MSVLRGRNSSAVTKQNYLFSELKFLGMRGSYLRWKSIFTVSVLGTGLSPRVAG